MDEARRKFLPLPHQLGEQTACIAGPRHDLGQKYSTCATFQSSSFPLAILGLPQDELHQLNRMLQRVVDGSESATASIRQELTHSEAGPKLLCPTAETTLPQLAQPILLFVVTCVRLQQLKGHQSLGSWSRNFTTVLLCQPKVLVVTFLLDKAGPKFRLWQLAHWRIGEQSARQRSKQMLSFWAKGDPRAHAGCSN